MEQGEVVLSPVSCISEPLPLHTLPTAEHRQNLYSVVVFLLYVFVLQHWPASRAAYIMVLVPFAAVVLSAWLDNEPVSVGLVLGGLLVLTGVHVGALRLARTSPMPAKAQPIVDFRGSD